MDDDREIAQAIGIYLEREGIGTALCYDGDAAVERLHEEEFHLVIMDIMMPKLDGIAATLKIRKDHRLPILFLSAKSEDADRIFGLNMGADDYITKPFHPLELIARVKSHLRRYTDLGGLQKGGDVISTGSLSLDADANLVHIDGEEVHLTAIEYRILRLLMQNLGRILSIDQIYKGVWGEPNLGGENTEAVHIRRIREKIGGPNGGRLRPGACHRRQLYGAAGRAVRHRGGRRPF